MVNKAELLKEYSKALRDGKAAIFVGAGISRAAGFVDWKQLLAEIAEDLGLSIGLENDLVALAQFDLNQRGSRDRLNQKLVDEFIEDATLTPSHQLIAQLPIHSVWTTNYDDLIEKAFEQENKRIDVKRREADFGTTRRRSDVTIYKMHGDKTDVSEAVLTKEDYESYHDKRALFTIAFKGDLTQKTFLFLGVSFTDPNITYILARVRQLLDKNSRQHYCIMKRCVQPESTETECNRFKHWIADLHRYNIRPILIDDYGEVPQLLEELNHLAKMNNVFVSGAAHDFSPLGEPQLRSFCRDLGAQLIQKDFNIISGFGAGLGSMLMLGAMDELKRNDDDRLQLWPFPRDLPDGPEKQERYRALRKKMISNSGVCIVVAGNKSDASGKIIISPGAREEVDIAIKMGKPVIPIGISGHLAYELWQDAQADPKKFYGSIDLTKQLATLGDASASPAQIIAAVIQMLKQLASRGR